MTKILLTTGTTSGIGEAAAKAIASQGGPRRAGAVALAGGRRRLALQTNSPVAIVVPEYAPQQDRIRVSIASMVEMEEVGSRQENVMHNARRVMSIIERAILAHPEQWQMVYPVWGASGEG